jgi:hypothetical protein
MSTNWMSAASMVVITAAKKGQNCARTAALYICNSDTSAPKIERTTDLAKLPPAALNSPGGSRSRVITTQMPAPRSGKAAMPLHQRQIRGADISVVRRSRPSIHKSRGMTENVTSTRSRNKCTERDSRGALLPKTATTPVKPASVTAICAPVLSASLGPMIAISSLLITPPLRSV